LWLLAACTESDVSYQYGLTWTCLSPEGCERADAVTLVDRLNIRGDLFFFLSTRTTEFLMTGQRIASTELPAGCAWVYGINIFGHELEPSKMCSTAGGFELELSIPNAIRTTYSEWLVEARDLGPW
jgi:hypothetical protein